MAGKNRRPWRHTIGDPAHHPDCARISASGEFIFINTACNCGASARAKADATLPYERLDSAALGNAIRLYEGERLLVLRPFGWHIDGQHIPNAAEHFSRNGVCREHRWEVVTDFGPYIAIVRPLVVRETEQA